MKPKRLPRLWCAMQGLLPIDASPAPVRRSEDVPGRSPLAGDFLAPASSRPSSLACRQDARGTWAERIRIATARRLATVAAMSLIEVKAEIPTAAADAANDLLLEHALENWSVYEDVLTRQAWVAGICADEREARTQWENLVPLLAAGDAAPIAEPVFRELGEADWRDSYKAHFKAWQFDRLHWVPVWERDTFQLPPGDAVLWLDPGLAFGTGNHETTRLCVERLVALAEEHGTSGRVIDAGCGSGILALSAALLGYRDVSGFDNDPEAVRISEENAALNGLSGRVRFFVGDLTNGLSGEQADVLLANIQADVLICFAKELVAAVAAGGTLVLSGILSNENTQVRAAFEALTPNWTINARIMGEWSDVVLVRPR